ncbi:MAG: nucleotidyl transferase AbiEii/AbiGii toxin family protein [Thermoleophilaceae bacterium]
MRYATPAAFRAALEARLNAAARAGGRPVGSARKLVAFTRLLARLERTAPDRWVLKGGFALELRLPGQARATRDVDIDWAASLDEATNALVQAAALALDDYFEFDIQRVGDADVGGVGGVRFHANAYVGGRLFEPLLIDVGVGSESFPPADELTAPDLLDFAEIEPAHIRAIRLEQHIAEKLHAYTRRHADDQPSSRAKDLIDIILMSELAAFDYERLRQEIVNVFEARGTHDLPASLPAPPPGWSRPYRALAEEVGLDPDLMAGHRLAAAFLDPILAAEAALDAWDAEARRWRKT